MSTKQAGDEHMAAGNKCSRKGWFHKPDYQGAAMEYDKAALAYKNAKEWALAVDAYKKVAECHKANGVLSASGRALESAAGCCKDGLGDGQQCAELYRAAAETYHLNNNDDRAADALTRGAKAIDTLATKASDSGKSDVAQSLWETAVQLIKDGINLYDDNEKLAVYGSKAVKVGIVIALRARIVVQAIELYEQSILINVAAEANRANEVHKAALSLIILHLARGDAVSAGRVYERECGRDAGGNERSSFVHSDFGRCATRLLDAWDSGDQDEVDAVIKSQDVTFLDNELVRIARGLNIEGEMKFACEKDKSSYVPITDAPAASALRQKSTAVTAAAAAAAVKTSTDGEGAAGGDEQQTLSIGDKREIAKMEENERNRQLLFAPSSSSSSSAKQTKKQQLIDAGNDDEDDCKGELKKGGPAQNDDDDDDDDSDTDSGFDSMRAQYGLPPKTEEEKKEDDVTTTTTAAAPAAVASADTNEIKEEEEEEFDDNDLC